MRASFPPFRGSLFMVLLILAVFCLLDGQALAVNRYVNTSGGVNSGGGTLSAPWKTIQYAANNALAGDVVLIRAGVYPEMVSVGVSGSAAGGYITFQAYPGESVAIDGSSVPVTGVGAANGLLNIINRSYLIFQNLEIRNYAVTVANDSDAIGVLIEGTSHHVELRSCSVHDIKAIGGATGDANGIAVYGQGTSQATAINNIIVDSCDIYNLITRFSESVTFNGNVDGFQFTNNRVHACDNIGVDCIGFEGTSAVPTFDQARNGVVRGNVIFDIDSNDNPAYGGDRAADGIYVDGGRDILIESNVVHHCNIGIEVGSEHAGRVASNVIARNNTLFLNHTVGIYVGGAEAFNGGAQNCQFLHNTLFKNDYLVTGGGQLQIQYYATGITITQNIFWAAADNGMLYDEHGTPASGHVINRNMYYADQAAANLTQWAWNGGFIDGMGPWKSVSGQDALSTFANPQFVSPGSAPPNVHLLANSPARNAGDPTFVPASGEIDIDKLARISETLVDLGSDEYCPTVTIASSDAAAAEWTSGVADTGLFTISRTAGTATSLNNAPLLVTLAMSGTATNGVDYNNLSIVAIPAAATSASVTLTPIVDGLPEGPETAIAGVALAPGLYLVGTPGTATVTIADRPLDQWKFTQFAGNAGNIVFTADNADPDGDGRPNLLEYVMGTIPTSPNSGPALTYSIESGYFTASMARSSIPVDVIIAGQVSSVLSSWTSGVTILENTVTKFKFRDNSLKTANPRRFLRVKVTP